MDADEDADMEVNSPTGDIDDEPETTLESATALIARLQDNTCTEPVKIHVSRNSTVRPAIVEQEALTAISKYFAGLFDISNNTAFFYEALKNHGECSFTFFEHTPDTVKLFLYWLEHGIILRQEDNDGFSGSDTEYQLLLARACAFAEDKLIPGMQNDAISALVSTFEDTELTQDSLQKILGFSKSGGMLRLAVLKEALWLENDGTHLLEGLQTQWLAGFGIDISKAKESYDRRAVRSGGRDRGRAARARAEEYFVGPYVPKTAES